ncbi:MAG: hypothetical protein KatS3mg111_0302 [Pirellulaceae bacterium]|nr:MAG: hypothetical protein KatS3mg111_0302 [Pirellulaceae bacterium]
MIPLLGRAAVGAAVEPEIGRKSPRLSELVELWDALDKVARRELLASARILAERCGSGER